MILKKESDDFEIELVKRLVDFTKVFSDYTDGSKNDGLKVQRDYLDVKNKKLKKERRQKRRNNKLNKQLIFVLAN